MVKAYTSFDFDTDDILMSIERHASNTWGDDHDVRLYRRNPEMHYIDSPDWDGPSLKVGYSTRDQVQAHIEALIRLRNSWPDAPLTDDAIAADAAVAEMAAS